MKRLLIFVLLLMLAAAAAFAQSLEITIPLRKGYLPIAVPPITTYRWRAVPGQPYPVEIRWILEPLSGHNDNWQETIDYIRDNPDAPGWYPWQPYAPPDVGTYWTTPWTDGGKYVFAIHGRDSDGNAGTVFDEDFNWRRIQVPDWPVPVEETTWGQIKALYD